MGFSRQKETKSFPTKHPPSLCYGAAGADNTDQIKFNQETRKAGKADLPTNGFRLCRGYGSERHESTRIC